MAHGTGTSSARWGAVILLAYLAGVFALFAAAMRAAFDRTAGEAG